MNCGYVRGFHNHDSLEDPALICRLFFLPLSHAELHRALRDPEADPGPAGRVPDRVGPRGRQARHRVPAEVRRSGTVRVKDVLVYDYFKYLTLASNYASILP